MGGTGGPGPHRPAAVAFDLVETVFSLGPVSSTLDRVAGEPGLLPRFFDRLLRDGFALSASGSPRPFREVATGALEVVVPWLDAPGREAVLDAFAELPAQADARPALERLADAGIVVVGLTNGSAQASQGLVQRAGLDDLIGRVLSVDDVGRWKPNPSVYVHVADAVGRPPGSVALVAVHAWDVHGARRAGLVTAWASRLEGTYASSFEAPHVTGKDLVEAVEGLLALPVASGPHG